MCIRDSVYTALEQVEQKTGTDPVATLKRALENVRPELEVKSRRVGGTTYQVPMEVRPRRATTLAIRWLTDFAKKRREKTMAERLANEIIDASNGVGAAVKRREDVAKMAESNKAFAHYRCCLLYTSERRPGPRESPRVRRASRLGRH